MEWNGVPGVVAFVPKGPNLFGDDEISNLDTLQFKDLSCTSTTLTVRKNMSFNYNP